MHRIDTDGALPGGLFGDGNPAVGQQGTIFDAAWMNDMQENIAGVIEHAGIALVKSDYTQLTQAIVAMVAGIVGSGGGAVPTTRKVLGGGILGGGGTLDADQTISLAAATAAAIIAGTAGGAVTPDLLAQAVGGNTGATDTITLPGGRIMKIGGYDALIPAEGQYPVVFGTPFPTACDRVIITGVNASAINNRDIWPQLVSKSKTGFIAFAQWTGQSSTTHSLDGFDYLAFGR